MIKNDQNRIPEHVEQYIYADVDGIYYYWPDPGGGSYSAENLRQIADRLDELSAAAAPPLETRKKE